jgi:hypothetical protein
MSSVSPTLEAVYYGSPIPRNLSSLTLLGLVFDRIHFPNVHLPIDGYDVDAVAKEAARIEGLGLRDYNSALVVGALRALPHVRHMNEFCLFSGGPSQVFGGVEDKELGPLVKALDEDIFGPPKEGFFPVFETGSHKGLPGGEAALDYPGMLHYPANAIVYSAKMGIPLVNDNPSLPVPGLGGVEAKHNAKLLASILALECVSFALPTVRPMSPEQLVEARLQLRPQLQPFRTAVMKLTKDLNAAISADADMGEISKAASFLVQTDIAPALAELSSTLSKPTAGWMTRGFEFAKQVPELASAFASMPTSLATAKAIAALGGVFVDLHDKSSRREAARSGLYYLLRLREISSNGPRA